MTLRWRLALLSGVVSTVVVVVMFIALFMAVRATLEDVLNRSLRGAVERRIDDLGRHKLSPALTPQTDEGARQDARPRTSWPGGTAVFDEHGTLVSGSPTVVVPLREGMTSTGGYRVLTRRHASGAWVQAYRAEDVVLSGVQGVLRVFLLVAPLVTLVATAGAYLLASRALRHVDRVTLLASRIAAGGKYDERLPSVPGQDEMARLTGTMNAMLDRLSSLIERERTFALAAAHELRTPLAVIRARASLALERERDGSQYRLALREIREVSTELTQLTDRLLALARSGISGDARPVDLAAVTLEAVELQSSAAPHVQVRLDLNAAVTFGDEAALSLAVSNLVQNALQHARSSVTVESVARRGRAYVRVTDDGPGIPDREVRRLMMPFQRGAEAQGRSGAGLGLALVNAVAEQHRGRVTLRAAPRGGTRASLDLPSCETEAELPDGDTRAALSGPASAGTRVERRGR